MTISYGVEDYNNWRTAFEKGGEKRDSAGCKSATVYVSPTDGKQITILFEWDTKENFVAFSGSDEVKAMMTKAGLTGPPNIKFLE